MTGRLWKAHSSCSAGQRTLLRAGASQPAPGSAESKPVLLDGALAGARTNKLLMAC